MPGRAGSTHSTNIKYDDDADHTVPDSIHPHYKVRSSFPDTGPYHTVHHKNKGFGRVVLSPVSTRMPVASSLRHCFPALLEKLTF